MQSGVNVRSSCRLPLTKKDRKDLRFGLSELGCDWVALFFILQRRPEDIAEAAKLDRRRSPASSPKLEKPAAIEHRPDRRSLPMPSWWLRGDLGVEMAPEDVPGSKAHHRRQPPGRQAGGGRHRRC